MSILRRFPILSSLSPSQLLSRAIRRGGSIGLCALSLCRLLYRGEEATNALFDTAEQLIRSGNPPNGQMLQDAWVLSSFGEKPGFFLDIGAAYPVKYSNTELLQRRYGWSGTLVEPNPALSAQLRDDRASPTVAVVEAAVGTSAGQARLVNYDALSSLETVADRDIYSRLRQRRIAIGDTTLVNVITISELLSAEVGNRSITFLSVDVEGMDVDIIESFPFDQYDVRLVSVEHNFDKQALHRIVRAMSDHGFHRVAASWSSIDAWFEKRS